jgi:hypothetical protein
MVGFDEYTRKARLTPGLLAIAPIAFLVVSLGWKQYPAVALATGIIGGAGAAYLLAILVRHMGGQAESRLWESWGGPPTTSLLRMRTSTDNEVRRTNWRTAIETVTGVSLLPMTAERDDPARADKTIEAAVSQVLRLGQDPNYPILHAENVQYGFERNFYGIRWIGRAIAMACVVILIASLVLGPITLGGEEVSRGAVAAGAVINLLFCTAWLMLPSEKRARLAAERYAKQLLQAVTAESRKLGQAG